MASDGDTLSKSAFLRGYQCPKSLYLATFEPTELEPPTLEAQARRETGRRVGILARRLFAGGQAARPDASADLRTAEARTRSLIDGGAPAIFEAVFQSPDGRRCAVDILARGDHGWRLIEVKSSTSAKPEHLPDVAFQLGLARDCGVNVESAEVLHLNRDYVRQGELDLPALFISSPVTAEAEALLPGMRALTLDLQQMLRAGRAPEVPIGPHCRLPRDCDALRVCWSDVPEESVLEIAYLTWESKFALYHRGVVRIDDVPEDSELPSRSRRHVAAHQGHQPILDRAGLRAFLQGLRDPIHLLDFETVAPAVPLWDRSRPYQQIPFLFSLHTVRRAGAEPDHTDFLADPGPDPRPALIDALLAATEGEGSILAYHMPFEVGVMKQLAVDFPDGAAQIGDRLPRMADLIVPFRSWQYWLPAMGGSFSIKSVAPALAPELTYDDLDIADGVSASLTYETLLAGSSGAEAAAKMAALRTYCERDTLAMVRVLRAIERAARGT